MEIDLAESGHLPLEVYGAATCGHLRPLRWNFLEWPLVATCLESAGAATCGHSRPLHLRPLAATRGHSLGTVWSGHLRPLAATCLELSGAATCGHLLPLAATRVAASGCKRLRVAASGCKGLRAVRNTWQSWHLEKKSVWLEMCFFQVWRLNR